MSDDSLLERYSSRLTDLPDDLKLRRGFVEVDVERWSDGAVLALLPGTDLYGRGSTEAEAVLDLAEDISALVHDLTEGAHKDSRLGGPMSASWAVLCEQIDHPKLNGKR